MSDFGSKEKLHTHQGNRTAFVSSSAEPASTQRSRRAGRRLSSREINHFIEQFEDGWIAAPAFLKEFVKRNALCAETNVISELVRVDIDLRYFRGHSVSIDDYFEQFPELLADPRAACGIAIEDYRNRETAQMSIEPSRWRHLPGIEQQTWFSRLVDQDPSYTPSDRLESGDSSIEEDLQPTAGKPFGDFHLLHLLGRGTFSEVYLARQDSLASRYVALKVVKRHLGEPAFLARMQHTGIVPIYSMHQVGRYSIICMPYSGSATMSDWLSAASDTTHRHGQSFVETLRNSNKAFVGNCLEPSEAVSELMVDYQHDSLPCVGSADTIRPLEHLRALDIRDFSIWLAQRLAAALSHAHERGIVHGDLKPANILIRSDGEPALIDFNLSLSSDLPPPDVVGGTLAYMAPEQLHAMLRRTTSISKFSDIFSLGVILYETIEGRLPFPAARSASEIDLLAALETQRNADQPRWTNRSVTPGTRSIVETCLQLTPGERYPDAGVLLEDIEREQRNLPLVHAKESRAARFGKLAKRYPRLFSSGSIGLVASLLVLLFGFLAFQALNRARRLDALATTNEVRTLSRVMVTDIINGRALANNANGTVGDKSGELNDRFLREVGLARNQNLDGAEFLQWLSADVASQSRRDMLDYYLTLGLLTIENARLEDLTTEGTQRLTQELKRIVGRCEELADEAYPSAVLPLLRTAAAQAGATTSGQSPMVGSPGGNLFDGDPVECILLARFSLSSGDAEQAVRMLRPLADESPFKSLFWLTLGESQLRLGQLQEARLTLTMALEHAPRLISARRLRAEAAIQMRDYDAAVEDYSQLISWFPAHANFHADRARVHELMRNFDRAIDDISAALRMAPETNRFLIFRSRLYRQKGNHELAMNDLRKAIESKPVSVEDWISRALARSQSHPEEALDDLQAALRLDPFSKTALQNMAYVQSELLDQKSQAIETLSELLSLDPDFEMARGGRCVLLARVGDRERALSDIDYLLKSGERSLMPATLYQIACAHSLLAAKHPENLQPAFRFLAKSIQRNYGLELLDTDPDLDNLREKSEFKHLQEICHLVR